MNVEEKREQQRLLWLLASAPAAAAIVVTIALAFIPAIAERLLITAGVALGLLVVSLATLLTMGLKRLARSPTEDEATTAALNRVRQLEAINTLIHRLASTPNVQALFKTLAARTADVVPCDRVAVALSDNGHEFQVYVASSGPHDTSPEPPQIHHFLRAGTLIGEVIQSKMPRVVPDLSSVATHYLDATVLASSGLRSAVIVPLTAEDLSVGALVALSRAESRLTPAHVDTLRPVADIIAVAFATQSLARALGRSQMAKDMADVMFSLANEINSALQAIVGHCELLGREYQDPALQRDLAMVSRQATRAAEVLTHVQGLAEARMQRATSVANLLEDAWLDDTPTPVATGPYDDVLKRGR